MMLCTKYEISGPCSFRQEAFWKFHFKTYLLSPWPTGATNWNSLNNFGRGPPMDHSFEVWSKSNERFQRRRCSSKKVDGRRTLTGDEQRPVTITHPEHFVLRWAKNPWACPTKRFCSWLLLYLSCLKLHCCIVIMDSSTTVNHDHL